jgi:hypothetical protein
MTDRRQFISRTVPSMDRVIARAAEIPEAGASAAAEPTKARE